MELRLNIDFNQLLSLIKQLPDKQIAKLKAELDKKSTKKKSSSEFQKLLLKGPVMSEEQYDTFVKNRESMSQWRQK